jgi:hypothetical protein
VLKIGFESVALGDLVAFEKLQARIICCIGPSTVQVIECRQVFFLTSALFSLKKA